MKNSSKMIILVVSKVLLLTECGFPGMEKDSTISSGKKGGVDRDVSVTFVNNCEKNLTVFFQEVKPGTQNVPCESFIDHGHLSIRESITVLVHKGNVGHIVFADNVNGKCSNRDRKSEYWIDASNSISSEGYFSACK